ncbi:MAG: tyrosine-type recombinase/integrase [Geminicoccales bacterium]
MKNKPPYVDAFKDRHGKLRTRYRRGKYQQRIEGVPGSAEWYANYGRIHESFERKGPAPAAHDTVNFAIERYLESARYRKRALSTQQTYMVAIAKIRDQIGTYDIKSFTRGRIVMLRDSLAAQSPGMAKLTLAVLKNVFEAACDLDMIERNPAKGIGNPIGHKATPHAPWTVEQIDTMLNKADPFMRRAVAVLLYTGLRGCDAVALKRSYVRDGIIRTIVQKTDTEVVIPMVSALREELARSLPVESLYLVPGRRGQMLTRNGLAHAIRDQMKKLDLPVARPHGLRKNAVANLIEAGADPRRIQAITGQSLQMIEHYGQAYKRENLALEAIELLERKDR